MSIVIWLDDFRNPDHHLGEHYMKVHEVHWCKNAEEFKTKFAALLPTAVHFDHDLLPEHYTPKEYWGEYDASAKYQASKGHKDTGYDCALWMLKYCRENKVSIPYYTSHSANPVGRDRILSMLNWETKENV
jgi:hypothetical protein